MGGKLLSWCSRRVKINVILSAGEPLGILRYSSIDILFRDAGGFDCSDHKGLFPQTPKVAEWKERTVYSSEQSWYA